jgi:hypothetical protein
MTTPSGDIVPRSNGFGGLGTSIKKWLNGYFYNIFATGGTISGVNMISASGETISGPVTTSAGVGDANKLVALNNLGIIDSTMISGTIGGSSYVGLTWNMATSSIPVLANNGYFLNPSGNITLTLPSSPSVGDPINIVDIYNKASTYVITVARNGNNIEGVAEDLIINIDGAGISLVYADVPRGWEIVSEIGRRGINSGTSDIESIVTSSGSVDAGKIPELGQDGLLDVSFFPEGIGGATVSGVSSSAGVVDAGKIPILDLDGLLDNSFFPEDIGGGISAGLSILASENLSPGNFINIYNDSGARCRKAIATSFETEAHGYVLTSASGSESIVVYFDGINDQLSGLIPGPLFLSTTPGLCSSTSASGSGNIVQRLGLAISETTMNFKPQAIILLE